MISSQNKRKFSQYNSLVEANKKSIGIGQTLVSAMIEKITEKKSKKGNTYWFIVATSLNKKPVFVQYGDSRDPMTKETVPFQPPNKKIKSEDGEESVPDLGDNIVTKNNKYGTILKPMTTLKLNVFDKSSFIGLALPFIGKVSLSADLYNDNVGFKVKQLITNTNPSIITSSVYNELVNSNPIGEIPTSLNIEVDESIPYEYLKRSFILPLSKEEDNDTFSEIDILVDSEDKDRFEGKMKDDDRIYPSVNMNVGEKNINALNVIFHKNTGEKFFFKFGYFATTWQKFGITDVQSWKQVAGRLIFNAKDWFVTGSSKLEDIQRMTSNSNDDDGYDFGDYDDDGYDQEDCKSMISSTKKNDDGIISSTGFMSSMSINLVKTVQAAGVEVSLDYVTKVIGPSSGFCYNSDFENPLNKSWMVSIEKNMPGIFNATEFNSFILPAFLDACAKNKNVKFYALFAVGDSGDKQYEKFDEDGEKPSTIFAII